MINKISKPVTNCNNNKYVNPDYYSVVVVQTLQERDNIPCKLRQNGTIAIVVEEGYAQYQIQTKEGIYSVCNNNAWTQIETGDKVFDGNNLIIINNEEHKREYLQSGLAIEGQMIFFVPENKYYKYDGSDFIDPFPNKLDKPLDSTMNPDNKLIPVYGQSGGNPEWLPSNTLGKVESVNGVTPILGTKNINLNLSDIPDNVGYATDAELTQLSGALDARIIEVEGINYTWNPTNRTLTLFDNSGRQMSQVSLVSLDNEGTDLRYNSITKSLELYNADNQLLDSIPVSDFVGNVGTALQLNSNTLQLKDSQGNILSSVSFSVSNISGLQSLLDSKLDKTTTTVAAPDSTFKYAYLADEDNNVRRMLAGDLGKNIANSNLTSVAGAGMTLGASYVWNTANQPFSITGLPDKSVDTAFNRIKVQNDLGQEAMVTNAYGLLRGTFEQMTASQALELGQLLNGGVGSDGAMSVNLISPPIVEKIDSNEYILMRGANLNLNATSKKIEILDSITQNVVITIPDNQIQIYSNGIDLIFYYNFKDVPFGNYLIKLTSGSKVYITTHEISVVSSVNLLNLDATTWDVMYDTPASNLGSNIFSGRNANIESPISIPNEVTRISAKSNTLFAQGSNFFLEYEITLSSNPTASAVKYPQKSYIGIGYANADIALTNNSLINSSFSYAAAAGSVSTYSNMYANGVFASKSLNGLPKTYNVVIIKTGNLFRVIIDGVNTSTTLSNNNAYAMFISIVGRTHNQSLQIQLTKAYTFN